VVFGLQNVDSPRFPTTEPLATLDIILCVLIYERELNPKVIQFLPAIEMSVFWVVMLLSWSYRFAAHAHEYEIICLVDC